MEKLKGKHSVAQIKLQYSADESKKSMIVERN